MARQLAEETGTWTPGFSLSGDKEVEVVEQMGHYWILRNAWEIEGWLTVTLDSSSTGFAAFTGLPFSLVNGFGQISVECVDLDGAIQVANNIPMRRTAALPLSLDSIPNRTYKFHIAADFESNSPVGDEL